jgi:hypothetical protein
MAVNTVKYSTQIIVLSADDSAPQTDDFRPTRRAAAAAQYRTFAADVRGMIGYSRRRGARNRTGYECATVTNTRVAVATSHNDIGRKDFSSRGVRRTRQLRSSNLLLLLLLLPPSLRSGSAGIDACGLERRAP